MTPEAFVEFLGQHKASAILRTAHGAQALEAMRCVLRAGFRVCEFTLTVPGALQHISTLSREHPDAVFGAGTVLDASQAREAVAAGARFLVSPVVDEEVIGAAHELGVAVIPGCQTPTEMLRAHAAGAQLIKLFPMPGSGPAYVQACLGPLPFLKIVPTSGVDGGNVGDFFASGAFAVGYVAPLFPQDGLHEHIGSEEVAVRRAVEKCRQRLLLRERRRPFLHQVGKQVVVKRGEGAVDLESLFVEGPWTVLPSPPVLHHG